MWRASFAWDHRFTVLSQCMQSLRVQAGPPRLCRALAAAPSPALTAPSVVQPPLSLASEVRATACIQAAGKPVPG